MYKGELPIEKETQRKGFLLGNAIVSFYFIPIFLIPIEPDNPSDRNKCLQLNYSHRFRTVSLKKNVAKKSDTQVFSFVKEIGNGYHWQLPGIY